MKPGQTSWTDAENAVLVELYATRVRMSEIVAKTGRTINAVYKQAHNLDLRRPTMDNADRIGKPTSERTKLALSLAARPNGVSRVDLGGSVKDGDMLARLASRDGHLFRGVLGHRTVRFFTTQRAADRWVAANMPAHQAQQALRVGKSKPRQDWAPDAPIHYPTAPDGTPLYRITIAPPPPARVWRTNTFA